MVPLVCTESNTFSYSHKLHQCVLLHYCKWQVNSSQFLADQLVAPVVLLSTSTLITSSTVPNLTIKVAGHIGVGVHCGTVRRFYQCLDWAIHTSTISLLLTEFKRVNVFSTRDSLALVDVSVEDTNLAECDGAVDIAHEFEGCIASGSFGGCSRGNSSLSCGRWSLNDQGCVNIYAPSFESERMTADNIS